MRGRVFEQMVRILAYNQNSHEDTSREARTKRIEKAREAAERLILGSDADDTEDHQE